MDEIFLWEIETEESFWHIYYEPVKKEVLPPGYCLMDNYLLMEEKEEVGVPMRRITVGCIMARPSVWQDRAIRKIYENETTSIRQLARVLGVSKQAL